tara:strand:+ start:2093 stop:2548 length:456 start_codon:yes stop_codon:yes gene_type:complete
MDNVARLTAIEAIKSLKGKYFRCLDTKDWHGFQSVFTADAIIEIPENFDTPFALEPFVAMVKTALANAVSIHHGHMPELDILSETDARGIWAMNDQLFFPPGDAGLTGAAEIVGAGHYHESYRCGGGEWRIAKLRLTRIYLQSRGNSRTVA